MAYSVAQDLFDTYGLDNIKAWADISNRHDMEEILSRIDWAIAKSDAFIDGRLSGGRYSVPFMTASPIINYLSALKAGVFLYDGRLITDADNRDQVGRQRKEFEEYLKQILRGQLAVVGATQTASNAPSVVRPGDPDLIGSNDRCGCYNHYGRPNLYWRDSLGRLFVKRRCW